MDNYWECDSRGYLMNGLAPSLGYPQFDEKDAKILAWRQAAFEAQTEPQIGDYVRFFDGTLRRISHVWPKIVPGAQGCVQTSDNKCGMSFFLGLGWSSYSGSLYPSVKRDSLILANKCKDGDFWFFHHNDYKADNAVYFSVPCKVWECNQEAPQ